MRTIIVNNLQKILRHNSELITKQRAPANRIYAWIDGVLCYSVTGIKWTRVRDNLPPRHHITSTRIATVRAKVTIKENRKALHGYYILNHKGEPIHHTQSRQQAKNYCLDHGLHCTNIDLKTYARSMLWNFRRSKSED
jgi:hypothetical protein